MKHLQKLQMNTYYIFIRSAKYSKYSLYALAIFAFSLTFTEASAQSSAVCLTGNCVNGHGVMVWPNGERYEGWFVNNMRDGYGIMRYENGDTYIGDWSENLRYGHGVYNYFNHSSKTKYVGEWKNNNIEGYGSLHLQQGEFQTGYWNKNQFKAINETDACINGDCENGWGSYIFADKSLYVGEFSDGKRHGQGTQVYRMGTKYKGTYVEGEREGFGTYYYINGNKYEGEWKRQQKVEGKMFSNGSVEYYGFWENNILVKKVESNNSDNIQPAVDDTPPTIEIRTPKVTRSPIVVSKKKKIRVHGVAKDASGIKKIRVNGVEAALGQENGQTRDFEAFITLAKKQTNFWVEATDNKDNIVKIDFTVVYEGEESLSSDQKDNEPAVIQSNSTAPRSALVIGNSTYVGVPLRNPMNDANAIARRLSALGFDVTLRLNVKKDDLKVVIREFGLELKKTGGVGLFYYAGHGIQLNGENYLVPVDAAIEKTLDIEVEAVKLQRVLNEMEFANNQMNIVILDACRDNPYSRMRSGSAGLAPIYGAPVGTFIAYATSPGQAASDGDGEHGLYTQELLNALDRSEGLKIEDLFKVVRAEVRKKSGNNQVPWENSSLIGNFIINPKN